MHMLWSTNVYTRKYFLYKLRYRKWEGKYQLINEKSPCDVTVDVTEWSSSGDAGGSVHEDILGTVSDWLWDWWWPLSIQVWQVHWFWASSFHSAGLSQLVLVLHTDWLSSLTDWTMGPASTKEADRMWVYWVMYLSYQHVEIIVVIDTCGVFFMCPIQW